MVLILHSVFISLQRKMVQQSSSFALQGVNRYLTLLAHLESFQTLALASQNMSQLVKAFVYVHIQEDADSGNSLFILSLRLEGSCELKIRGGVCNSH